MPVLRQLYDSLQEPRRLTPEEIPFGEFLRSQGALTLGPEPVPPGLAVEPRLWRSKQPGHYLMPGDGEGGCWCYHYQPGMACLNCLLRWWMGRHHGSEWWERLRAWPDFRLSWRAEAVFPQPPQPGELNYLCRGRVRKARVFPHPDCGCGARDSGRRNWGSWVHPISGPLQGVVERHQQGLWRVSARLGEAASSGANPNLGKARRAALAEACERWAALQPCARERVRVRRLGAPGSRTCWSGLVYLGEVPQPHGQQLSHGLACGPSLSRALRAGFWELIERDGLRRWWRAWIAGRQSGLMRLAEGLWVLKGPVYLAFCGQDGRGAWGSAAGPDGARRARAEALHNFQVLNRTRPAAPEQCLSFADHAAWGWNEPIPRWSEMSGLPLVAEPPCPEWRKLALRKPVYYARLQCHWAEQSGWTIVKVLSPRLRGLGIGGRAPFHPFS